MEPPKGLLEDIITRLLKLPGKRTFTISALVSQARKSPASVFPYAPDTHDAEVYIQDVVLLLAERSGEGQSTYVSGLEAVLYIFPKSQSIIVYISKVDSTGQGIRPSPTKTLVLAFLEHISSSWFISHSQPEEDTGEINATSWSVWVQLFARAQNQYLFPASIEYKGKRVLSDIGLVKWWKGVLEEYISALSPMTITHRPSSKYIIIPGLPKEETALSLRIPLSNVISSDWIIGHPYTSPNITYPLDVHPPCSISQLIPYFPDDPKARLLDEIANTTTRATAIVSSPPSKRRKLDDGEQAIRSTEDVDGEEEGAEEGDTKLDYLRTVSADEFWARMDGRQECRLGTVAFFSTYLGKQITHHSSAASTSTSTKSITPIKSSSYTRPKRAEVTVAMLKKVTTSLDNHDFGTTEKAAHSTELLQSTIRSLASAYVSVTSSIPGMVEEEEVDTREGIAGSEAKDTTEAEGGEEDDVVTKYIIREVSVDNPDLPPKVESAAAAPAPVTVLTVRKKKKPPTG